MKRNPGIIDDADLILVMEDELHAGLPPEKTHLISSFFGKAGPIEKSVAVAHAGRARTLSKLP